MATPLTVALLDSGTYHVRRTVKNPANRRTRFVAIPITKLDGPVAGLLTMLVVLAPGVFDIVMFGE
jgi:hypothetical protein